MPLANLVRDTWLPIRRDSGPGHIKLHELTTDFAADPILDLDWPRADFRIAGLEMLIGLLATACPPKDAAAWESWWKAPPSADVLASKFSALASAFDIDGDGPRFCQDLEDFPGDAVPVERLLIDAPGENTVKRNTDLLVKRDRVALLGRPAAAMALYTLQTFAPSGGAGHRTSLRGGGPLTTLVRPAQQDGAFRSLWHLLWANVPCGAAPEIADLPKIFPWLAATRRSEGDAGTVLGSDHAHPLQAFWGMPRRIRLDMRAAQPGDVCGITGVADTVVVTGFRTRPWGVQYVNAAHFHPLTPTYKPKPADPPLAVHPQPDGIGYRHWHQLAGAPDPDKRYLAAATVETFMARSPLGSAAKAWAEARLLVGGYDTEKGKARSFIEMEMPFFVIDDAARRRAFLALSRSFAQGATEAAAILRGAIRTALEIDDNDRTTVDDARMRFFEGTTSAFWSMLRAMIADETSRSGDDLARDRLRIRTAELWLDRLRAEARAIFDAVAPLDPLAPSAAGVMDGGQWKPPPVVEARRSMGLAFAGYGKHGAALFSTLGLALPDKASAKLKAEKARKGKAAAHG